MRRFALIATAAAILVSLAAPPVQAAGLVHCVNQTHRGACYEPIWVDGRQVRMVFPQAGNDLSLQELDRLLVVTRPAADEQERAGAGRNAQRGPRAVPVHRQ